MSLTELLASLGKRTLIMGVLNVTPDSFSDGGLFENPDAAVRHGLQMIDSGADIVDVGGESTRPNAKPVPLDEELRRAVPIVERLTRAGALVSIDTRKPPVAQAAIDSGATIINDVSAGTYDPHMLSVAASSGLPICLMHMRGTPQTMQNDPRYNDVVIDIRDYLKERADAFIEAGVRTDRIWVDPGIGFGKTLEHNIEILRRLSELRDLGYPILVGTSRKAFIGKLLGGLPPEERIEGTSASIALAIAGRADIVRVHDVRHMKRVTVIADAIVRARGET